MRPAAAATSARRDAVRAPRVLGSSVHTAGDRRPQVPSVPATQDKYESESHPSGRGNPGCSYTEFTELTITFLLGHSQSPVAREPRRDLGPKCRSTGAQQGQGRRAWVPGTDLGRGPGRLERVTCREPPPGLAARQWSPSPGRSCRDEFLSSTLQGSSSRTTGLLFTAGD